MAPLKDCLNEVDHMDVKTAERTLVLDAPQNVALLQMLRQKSYEAIYTVKSAVGLRVANGETMVSAANAEDLDALITLMGPDTLKNTIYLARYSLYPVLERRLGTLKPHCFLQYFAQRDALTPMTCSLDIRPVTLADAPFVQAHYGHGHGARLEYVEERIQKGPGYLALAETGSIAGFILTHTEGSMGMLEVLPPYRGMGIGPALEYRLAQELDRRGLYIYSNVLPDNTNSIRIHAKLGFTRCPDLVSWLDPMAQE